MYGIYIYIYIYIIYVWLMYIYIIIIIINIYIYTVYMINISLTSHNIRETYGKHIWENLHAAVFWHFLKVWRMGWRDLKQLKIRSTLSYLPVQHCWQWVKSNMFNTGTIIHFHQESSIQKKCVPEVSTVIVRWFLSVLQMGRSLRLLDSWTSYDTVW